MINVFRPETEEEDWEVWSDTEVAPKDGRCLGIGLTEEEALTEALKELADDIGAVSDSLRRIRGL